LSIYITFSDAIVVSYTINFKNLQFIILSMFE